MTEQASLYDRLGGREALQTFASVVVKRAMLDDTIGHIWNHATEYSVQREINGFVDWMSEHWGGPDKYHGPDMATIHRGMGITEEYWDALFVIIDNAYEEFGLAPELVEEVDAYLRSFKPAIVGSPTLRNVAKEHPDMDVMDGIKSVGVVWPAPQQPARAAS
ncbi:group 1 truncated hemoglobin [Leucobacter weissii]|uniref:Group 1 truncated hemoglobin n=1 Tax=Leucobacter weissii TaxID=1983706 RepID=A0A939ML49_9MICO|nr:group 1 truncated hemoglobin [Leucobacter weissii]MBO1902988.1 group 1 truncated hemoglobin [Leucobacter weissii]